MTGEILNDFITRFKGHVRRSRPWWLRRWLRLGERLSDSEEEDGYDVSDVQNSTLSLADDVAVTRRMNAAQTAPVILVGHSYGGAVITEAGTDPKVAGLVYVAVFAPDRGESVASLIKDSRPGAPVPPILPPQDGFLFLDRAELPASFGPMLNQQKLHSWQIRKCRGA